MRHLPAHPVGDSPGGGRVEAGRSEWAARRGTRERGRMSEVLKLTRRQFVALWPGATAGFALGVYVAGLPRAAFAAAAPSVFIPNVFVSLDSTGAATIMLAMA